MKRSPVTGAPVDGFHLIIHVYIHTHMQGFRKVTQTALQSGARNFQVLSEKTKGLRESTASYRVEAVE